MKLRQIEFATAIARTGSFSGAAAQCNATQPTLSSALGQLEQELGGTLFSRTTRKVELTPFGRAMLPYLEAVLSAHDEAAAAARGFLEPARALIRIGMSPLVDMRVLGQVTAPYQQAHPQTELFFKECLLEDLSARLEAGAIDLAILPEDIVPAPLERSVFYADALRYLPAHGGPVTGPLRLADLPPDPVIMTGGGCGLNRMLEVLFQAEEAPLPRYPGQALSYQIIQDWAWLGLGAGILPNGKLTDPNLASAPLMRRSGAPAQVVFHWVWRREIRELPHMAAFVDHIRGKAGRIAASGPVPSAI